MGEQLGSVLLRPMIGPRRVGGRRSLAAMVLGLVALGLGPALAAGAETPAAGAAEGPIRLGPRVALRPCCGAIAVDATLAPRGGFGIALAAGGGPVVAGTPDDVYYVGDTPRPPGWRAPAGYRLVGWGPDALRIDLAERYPQLREVRFPRLGDAAAEASGAAVTALLRARYGQDAGLRRLGRGGHQVATRVCPKSGACRVVKLRRLEARADGDTGYGARREASEAAAALRRDLVMLAVAERVARAGRFVAAAGLRAPGDMAPAAQPAPRPQRFVRVAAITDTAALADGIVEQELVAWRPSAELEALLAGMVGASGPSRDAIWRQAADAGVSRQQALIFADRYQSAAAIGPDLVRLLPFVRDCARWSKVPKIAEVCAVARRDFKLPEDFEARVAALEQLYRDVAPLVVRLVRQHLGEAVANKGSDGRAREVGLDLNHGRNVGWDPITLQFVIFDA